MATNTRDPFDQRDDTQLKELVRVAIGRRASELRDREAYEDAFSEAMLAAVQAAEAYDNGTTPQSKTKRQVCSNAVDNAANRVLYRERKHFELPVRVGLGDLPPKLDTATAAEWSNSNPNGELPSDLYSLAMDYGEADRFLEGDPVLAELKHRALSGQLSPENRVIVLMWTAKIAVVAERTGLSVEAVKKRRQRLIREVGAQRPPFVTTADDDASPDGEVASLPRVFNPD